MFSSDRVVVKLTKAVQESVAWKKELIKEAKPMKSAKIGSISFCFRQEDVYTVTPDDSDSEVCYQETSCSFWFESPDWFGVWVFHCHHILLIYFSSMSKKYWTTLEKIWRSVLIISPGSFVCISHKKTLFAESSCVCYSTNQGSNSCFVFILLRNVIKKL